MMLIVTRREIFAAAAFAAPSVAPPALAPSAQPAVRLTDGSSLPFISFGTQIYDDDTAYQLTSKALEAGFRSFFASIESGNQRGFARAIRDSRLPREELFISGSVLSDAAAGYRNSYRETQRGVLSNMENMAAGGIGKLDLLLLEYPGNNPPSIRGQWRGLHEARDAGLVSSLGVSNFDVDQLDIILADGRARSAPQVNQLPLSLAFRMPYPELIEAHIQRGVALQAWSPLGGPEQLISPSIMAECVAMGGPLRKSGAQVALRWLVQNGIAITVHSRSAAHLRDDARLFDFSLTAAQMARLDELAVSLRVA
mmetsp:Transcript_71936/g.160046  ORF Transcript_71936/g.160046 Transcript_71936/m.160046 type:complete len:311 (-) Transcript_71936:163-1095(-)